MTVVKSGRVASDSQRGDPTRDCIWWIICCISLDVWRTGGILSMGWPDRYEVPTGVASFSPALSIK